MSDEIKEHEAHIIRLININEKMRRDLRRQREQIRRLKFELKELKKNEK